jgi:hypothetical protein
MLVLFSFAAITKAETKTAQADPCYQYVLGSDDGLRQHWTPQNLTCKDGSRSPLGDYYRKTPEKVGSGPALDPCYQFLYFDTTLMGGKGWEWVPEEFSCRNRHLTPLVEIRPKSGLDLDPCYQYVLGSDDGRRQHWTAQNATCADGSSSPMKDICIKYRPWYRRRAQ